MIKHPNLTVGNGQTKMYQLDSNTKSLNNENYHIEYENQESPRNENPESQPNRKSSGCKKSSKGEKEEAYYDPLPIESLIDENMIEYAKNEGIKDEKFFKGRMPRQVCNILS